MNKNIRHLITRAGLLPPKLLTLMITNGCNLKCVHCLTESRSSDEALPVPTDRLKRLISDFAGLGTEKISLAGGEPLLHPDWFEIVKFCCEIPGIRKIRIQTNGTLLSEPTVQRMLSLESKYLCIQVSLEGATARTNDQVRGQGSFDCILKGLKLLAANGLGKQTCIAFTEMRHNFGELPDLLELADGLGVGSLISGTVFSGGRAARAAGQVAALPTPAQYRDLLNRYNTDADFRHRYERIGNIAALEWYKGKSDPVGNVCTCIENPFVTADGRMFPCALLQAEEYSIKGLHKGLPEDVIVKGLARWSELPRLARHRSAELKECQKCPGREHCAGGCMGRAYAAHGDLMSVEDRCSLRQAIYNILFTLFFQLL